MKRIIAAIVVTWIWGAVPSTQATSRDDLELARLLTIEQVDGMHGLTFEAYVCRILETQGYAVENIRASNDYGVDAVASRGKDRIAIQIKRSKHPIDRQAISDASAGKEFYKCNRAMVVTNSTLTDSAKKFAEAIGCQVVERPDLLLWIAKFKEGTRRPSSQPEKSGEPEQSVGGDSGKAAEDGVPAGAPQR
jgi:HJR/Mrr/RecB family endonuclease